MSTGDKTLLKYHKQIYREEMRDKHPNFTAKGREFQPK
jgi:hypothetical protein